jgi:hypothetical protein
LINGHFVHIITLHCLTFITEQHLRCQTPTACILNHTKTAKEAFDEICRIYGSTNTQRIHHVMHEFNTTSRKPGESIDELMAGLKVIFNQLNQESVAWGANELHEILLLGRIQSLLPAEYAAFKNRFNSRDKTEQTFERFKEGVRNFRDELLGSSSIDAVETLAALHVKSFNKDRKSITNAPLSGHKGSDAASQVENGNHRFKQSIQCTFCYRRGHVMKDCFKLKAASKSNKKKALAVVNSDSSSTVLSQEKILVQH